MISTNKNVMCEIKWMISEGLRGCWRMLEANDIFRGSANIWWENHVLHLIRPFGKEAKRKSLLKAGDGKSHFPLTTILENLIGDCMTW